MSFIDKILKYSLLIYIIITVLVLFSLKINIISYGDDLTDALMFIVFIIIFLVIILMYLGAKKLKSNMRLALQIFLTLVIIFISCYYFTENEFSFKW